MKTIIFYLLFLFPTILFAQPFAEQTIITASDGEINDMFGNALSIRGNIAVIGTPQDDDIANNAGAVYVYERTGTNWNFVQKLTASDGEEADMLGTSVDIDGDYIVAGAYQAVGNTGNTGAAYIYKFNGTNWEFKQKIYASDGESADNFGKSIAISGDYIVAGADNEDFGSGAAYVFHRTDETWSQIAKLQEDDEETMDYFACSVDIDGDFIAAGSWQNNEAGSNSGAVYVFRNNSGTWEQYTKLVHNNAVVDDALGYSVAISGNYIVAGAHAKDAAKGAAYVFYNDNGTWTQQAKLTASNAANEDYFGKAVCISSDYIISAAQRHDETKSDEGAVYLYVRDGTDWSQQKIFTASDASDTGLYGYTVAIDGEYALVSTVQENGKVYVLAPENTGINSFDKDIFSVFPNPAGKIIHINSNKTVEYLYITDISGRKIKSLIPENNKTDVDISNFTKGIYFLTIKADNKQLTRKIIVK